MRQLSPAASRNIEPIGNCFANLLPPDGCVLELASGPGQHVVAFAERFPHLRWQPSDVSEAARASISAWTETLDHQRIAAPVRLDLEDPAWYQQAACEPCAMFAINVCHISPWSACVGLMTGAGQLLSTGAALMLYGPFMRDNQHTAASNAEFDQSLRARNSSWGIRDLGALNMLAETHGLAHAVWHDMPANNAVLEFRKL